MCGRFGLETVESSLRYIINNYIGFGWKKFHFRGNFRQILPVVAAGSRAQIINAFFSSSPLFGSARNLDPSQNMRLSELHRDTTARNESIKFPEFLFKVGEGLIRHFLGAVMILLPTSVTSMTSSRSL